MIDEQIRDHLLAGAESIELPPGDLAAVMGRGSRRRRSRQALSAIAATACLVAAVAVVDRTADRTVVAEQPEVTVVESPLDWRVIEPPPTDVDTTMLAGMPFGGDVTGADGTLYRLAPADPDDISTPVRLYATVDGVAWVEVPTPFEPRVLASSPDGRLLLVGTRSTDGVPELVVASGDGGEDWEVDTVALGLDRLSARSRAKLSVHTDAAAWGPHGRVAAVGVWADLGLERFVPDESFGGSRATSDGVDILTRAPAGQTPEVQRRVTWDELDVDPDIAPYVEGSTYLVDLDHDHRLDAGSADLISPDGSAMAMLADESGYYVVTGGMWDADGELVVPSRLLHSSDGASFGDTEPIELHGHVFDVGAIGRRAAFAVQDPGGRGGFVYVREGSGWRSVDLTAAVPGGAGANVHEAQLGPLGVAALVALDSGSSYVVHSTDGRAFSAVALEEHLPPPAETGRREGLALVRERITVAVTGRYPLERGGEPPRMAHVLVGTPPD